MKNERYSLLTEFGGKLMESMNYWEGKRILITGGTAGLGRELALKAAVYGAKVVVVGRNKERLESISENPAILGIQGDMSIREDIHKISGQAIGQLGGLDVLFNNASYLGMTPLRMLIDTD